MVKAGSLLRVKSMLGVYVSLPGPSRTVARLRFSPRLHVPSVIWMEPRGVVRASSAAGSVTGTRTLSQEGLERWSSERRS